MVAQELLKSDLQFDGLSWRDMARYVAINTDQWEWERDGISHLIPDRRFTKGVPPGMTSADVMAEAPRVDEQWTFNEEADPSPREQKMLFIYMSLDCSKVLLQ